MIKRIFDFSFSFIGLIVLSPLLFFIFLAIKIDSIGPVLFSQKRVGKDGELFTLVKFRSMNLKQNSNSTTTTHGYVRITEIGEFLRKYKLDELPELWNVIKGDMSLVGPRPDVPGYADFLRGEDRNILKLKPGITGPASLKYANEEEILARQENPKEYNDKIIYPDKVRINLDYYYQSNLWIDIKIIFATIFRISY